MTPPSQEQLLHRLAVEAALRDIATRFARAADSAMSVRDAVAEFVEDGVFEVGGQAIRGHDAIAAFLQQARDAGLTGPTTGTRHLVTNVLVQAGGPNGATGSMEWLLLVPGNDGAPATVAACGQYADRYREENGRWLIEWRRVTS